LAKSVFTARFSNREKAQLSPEEALRESEAKYRLLAETSTDMISRHDPKGSYIYVSPASFFLLGFEPEELVGRSAYEFFHPEDIPAVRVAHSKVLHHEEIVAFEYRIRRKDGSYTWFETTSHCVVDELTGKIGEIHASSRDISKRKEAERALREREAELHSFFNSPGQLRGIVELEGDDIRQVSVNLETANYIGLAPDEIRNCLASELGFSSEVVALWRSQYELSKRNGAPQTFEFEFQFPGGSVWASSTVSYVGVGPTGKDRFTFVSADITERKKVEMERERLLAQLQEALREVKALSGLLPICACCKRIRDDNGYWQQLETYLHEHANAQFSHGICPCCEKLHTDGE
jgi:PAS domain S-box-containing protein